MGAGNQKVKLPKELDETDIERIQSRTRLSRYEIVKWYSDFYEFSNGSQLNQHFFVKYFKELLPGRGKPEEFCRLIFRGFDTDRSNLLDFSEMITGMTVFFQGKPKEKMELMFRVYDQNQDGYIDMNELQIAIQAILTMTEEDFDPKKFEQVSEQIAESLMMNKERISQDEFVRGTLTNSQLRDFMCPKS